MPETGREAARATRSNFFLIAAALMTLIVFLGFLPSFYFRFQFRTTALPAYLIVHGLVMTAWQLLFLAQTILVARSRTDLHRRLGFVGAGLAALVVVVGMYATLNQPALYAAAGIELPFPIEDLVIGNIFGFFLFGGLVAAAIMLRRNSAWHRRLIYWACIVTMGPALTSSRSLGSIIGPYFPMTFPPEVALVWIAWIALLLHDWRSTRGFHPATIIGGMLILFVSPALLDWFLLIEPVKAWVASLA
ncbi:MAG: hypothetical protein EOP39_27770 [Rubrivivax sp.]|nr:MAG: hypothetical protein EOP39_27770 [Rubrivivax sp.]